MIASHSLRRTILSGVAGAVLMAILLPGLALVRDTTGHDWYAAGKLIVTEAMIAAGFDPSVPTEYRASDGSIRRVTRRRFAYTVEAWQARSHILSTIKDNALLGAGFAGAVLLAILSTVASGGRRERMPRGVVEPMHGEHRLPSHHGPSIAEVLSQAESGARAVLQVTPAQIDRLAGILGQAGRAPLLPAAEPNRNPTKDTSTRRQPDAESAGHETGAEASGPVDEPKPDPDGARRAPEKSGSSPKQASGRDGSPVAKRRRKRPGPDDDEDWF